MTDTPANLGEALQLTADLVRRLPDPLAPVIDDIQDAAAASMVADALYVVQDRADRLADTLEALARQHTP